MVYYPFYIKTFNLKVGIALPNPFIKKKGIKLSARFKYEG